MQIDTLVVGALQENCYIITKNNFSIIIDPGDEALKIIEACKNKNVKEILVTHNHFDHVGALKEVENYFKLKANNKSGYFDYEVIHNPGHSADSKTFYFKENKIMFCGDFIFYGTIGRTDLETGSDLDMIKSLKLIQKYPDDIILYPGHGPKTTLGDEKKRFNYYY